MKTQTRSSLAVIRFAVSLSLTAPSAVAEQMPLGRYEEIREGAYSVVAQVREWFARLPELADGGVEVMRMIVLGMSK